MNHIIRKYKQDPGEKNSAQLSYMRWWNNLPPNRRLRQTIYRTGNNFDGWLCEQKDFLARQNFLYDSGQWKIWCMLLQAHDFTGGNIGQEPHCVYCCESAPGAS